MGPSPFFHPVSITCGLACLLLQPGRFCSHALSPLGRLTHKRAAVLLMAKDARTWPGERASGHFVCQVALAGAPKDSVVVGSSGKIRQGVRRGCKAFA